MISVSVFNYLSDILESVTEITYSSFINRKFGYLYVVHTSTLLVSRIVYDHHDGYEIERSNNAMFFSLVWLDQIQIQIEFNSHIYIPLISYQIPDCFT